MAEQSTSTQTPPELKGFAGLSVHLSRHKIDVTLWFTRLLNICFTLLYFVPIFGSQFPAHQKALLSSAVTSALRLYQRQPEVKLSRDYFLKALGEDSFHYLAFSILFASVRPISLALIPLFLFSVLHFSSYSLTLMEFFGANSLWALRLFIHVVEFQTINILHLVALSEIVLMPYLICLALSWQLSFTVVFLYYHFLIMRCHSRRNPYTRNMFHQLRLKVNGYANQRGVPSIVKTVLLKSTYYISKLGLYEMDGQQAQ